MVLYVNTKDPSPNFKDLEKGAFVAKTREGKVDRFDFYYKTFNGSKSGSGGNGSDTSVFGDIKILHQAGNLKKLYMTQEVFDKFFKPLFVEAKLAYTHSSLLGQVIARRVSVSEGESLSTGQTSGRGTGC